MSSPLPRMVATRLRESLRYPETIFWTFVFPALLAVALGIAFRSGGVGGGTVAVVAGPGADRIAAVLAQDNVLTAEVLGRAEAQRRLRGGRAVLLVVPGDPLVYRYDPTRPESRLAKERADRDIQRAAGRTDPVPVMEERVTERGSRYIDFLIPGLLGMNLMAGGLWGIGWTIVEDRIKKLLRLQVATPMPRPAFLLTHVLVRLCYLPLEIVPLLLLARLLFGVSTAGSLPSLFLAAVAGTLSFAGIGILVASRPRTTAAISGLINFVSFPMIVVSGVFFSTERFPESVQTIVRFLPLTALVDALRAVMSEGSSLLSLGPDFAVLAVWGIGGFAAGLAWFRWK
jgi:ABC-2 type transport system permease protein